MEKTNTEVANMPRTIGINGEDIAQMVGSVVDTIMGLSQKVSEDNAARYQAEADVLIEGLKCQMETEIQEIEKYAGIREIQEENFQKIIDVYSSRFVELSQAGSEPSIDESRREFIIKCMDSLKNATEMMLNNLSTNISNEQNTHLNTIQPEKRGIFGFLRKKD